MRFPYGFTLHVTRRGTRGKFGAPITDSSHDVEDCAAAPAGSTEIVNGQPTVTTHDTIYGPYAADVLARDVVTVPTGQPIPAGDYEVDGEPERYRHPITGWEAGSVIRLTRVDGNA